MLLFSFRKTIAPRLGLTATAVVIGALISIAVMRGVLSARSVDRKKGLFWQIYGAIVTGVCWATISSIDLGLSLWLNQDERRNRLSRLLCWVSPNMYSHLDMAKFLSLRDLASEFYVSPNGDHPVINGNRKKAANLLKAYGELIGRKTYDYSCDPETVSSGGVGCHSVYHMNDLKLPSFSNSIPHRSVVVMTDVDYYLEVSDFYRILSSGRIILAYTYLITKLRLSNDEYVMYFNDKGELVNVTRGGHPYQHSIWDWNIDTVAFVHRSRIIFCTIGRIAFNDNRAIIGIFPVRELGWFGSALMMYLGVPLTQLQRFNPVQDTGVQILRLGDTVEVVSRDVSRIMSTEQYASLTAAYSLNGPKTSVTTVSTILESEGTDYVARDMVSKLPGLGNVPVNLGASLVRNYNVVYKNSDPVVKPVGYVYMQPLVDGSFVPADSADNDKCCIENRVVKFLRRPVSIELRYYKYRTDFVDHYCSLIGELCPMPIEEVISGQSGAKREKYRRADEERDAPDRRNESFVKKESYSGCSAPRAISGVDSRLVVELLQYINSACHASVRFDWYAFGKHPAETAVCVHKVASRRDYVIEGDYSKFDGTQTEFTCDLTRMILVKLFPHHADVVNQLCLSLNNTDFKTAHRIVYNTGYTRKSGSAETSYGNTMLNCFVHYCALRETGYDNVNAWDHLGVFGGDDSIMCDVKPEVLTQVAADLALVLKSNVKLRGSRISFLARIYNDAWSSPISFHDPLRALAKLHFTPDRPSCVTRDAHLQIMWRKCVSLYVSEADNFLGLLAKKCLVAIGAGIVYDNDPSPTKKHLLEGFEFNKLLCATDIIQKYPYGVVNVEFHNALNDQFYTCLMGRCACGCNLDLSKCTCGHCSSDDSFDYFVEQTGLPGKTVVDWAVKMFDTDDVLNLPTLYQVEPKVEGFQVEVDGQHFGTRTAAPPTPPKLCNKHMSGGCPHGAKCKYIHLKDGEFCRRYIKGQCKSRTCKFPHVGRRNFGLFSGAEVIRNFYTVFSGYDWRSIVSNGVASLSKLSGVFFRAFGLCLDTVIPLVERMMGKFGALVTSSGFLTALDTHGTFGLFLIMSLHGVVLYPQLLYIEHLQGMLGEFWGDAVAAVIVAPAYEEFVKRFLPGWYFGFCEAVHANFGVLTWITPFSFLFRITAHEYLARLPYTDAVGWHRFVNCIGVLIQLFNEHR